MDFRADPESYPLNTPSGKIEIFSKKLYDLQRPEDIPAIPKYIQEWESPFGPEARQYPLQAIGHHTLHRVHSTHDNNDWLEEAFPQRVTINPIDAEKRQIADGDLVKVFNDRGTIIAPCRLSKRIMPGVVDIPQGAAWTPDEDGVDRRGSTNVLTSERWTPLAFGNTQHTIMVQVERAGEPSFCQQSKQPSHLKPIPLQPGITEAQHSGQLAFFFDASACVGCKTCQTACKDRNNLPVGILWRRVYEIVGGNWKARDAGWDQDIFSYNISLACSHCENPVCVEVCPTRALVKREDGIVLIDAERCIGCQYCSWACPYDALQYNAEGGTMTKCTFCVEEIDAGRPPSCVAACPMRALDYGDKQALIDKYNLQGGGMIYPLPEDSYTKPSLLVRVHRDVSRANDEPAQINNREEV